MTRIYLVGYQLCYEHNYFSTLYRYKSGEIDNRLDENQKNLIESNIFIVTQEIERRIINLSVDEFEQVIRMQNLLGKKMSGNE